MNTRCPYPHVPKSEVITSDKDALAEALAEANERSTPVKTGHHRWRWKCIDLAWPTRGSHLPKELNPDADTAGKSVVSENIRCTWESTKVPCRDELPTRRDSDCLIMLGAFLTDIDMESSRPIWIRKKYLCDGRPYPDFASPFSRHR